MSVNKWIGIGNLGKDPELRYTPSGVAVCTFSIATTEKYKDKEGQQVEKTEWHNIQTWRGLAEVCGKYLTKGKQVYIEGKIQTRSYDDRDGNKKYITEIVAENMQMLSRNDGQSSNGQTNNTGNTGVTGGQESSQSSNGQANLADQAGDMFNDGNGNIDDIPF